MRSYESAKMHKRHGISSQQVGLRLKLMFGLGSKPQSKLLPCKRNFEDRSHNCWRIKVAREKANNSVCYSKQNKVSIDEAFMSSELHGT